MNFKLLIIIVSEIILIVLEQFFEYKKLGGKTRNVLNKIIKYLFIIDICYFIVIYFGLNNIKDINTFIKNVINIFATEEETIKYCQSIKKLLLSIKYIAKDFLIYYILYRFFKYISYNILHMLQKKIFRKKFQRMNYIKIYIIIYPIKMMFHQY